MRRWAHIAAGAVIVVGAVAAYRNCLFNPFVLDDVGTIVENRSIRHLWQWPQRASGVTTSGRPLLNFSLAVNYALGGTTVWGYHALNVAIHICAALTLFGIVRRTLERPGLSERYGAAAVPLATAVAVLWTVHPLQTASVTYVVQRAESLMGLFYLLTLYCFIRGWYGLSVAACVSGLMTKEVMVTAPVIVLLYDRTFVAGTFREAWRQRGRYYMGLASTWLVLGYLLVGTGNRAGTAGLGTHVSSWQYALTQCWAITRYLWLSVWPDPLIFDYGTWLAGDAEEVLWSALVLAALVTGVVVALRRRSPIGFLGAWFFLILAPTSSVVPVVTQTVAEHRMYLPLAAVVALVVVGLGRRWMPLFVGLAVVLGYRTWQRNADYRSASAIWSDTVAKQPGNLRAHYSLGAVWEQAGRFEEAMRCYEQVLRGNSRYAEAHNRLGYCLTQAGRLGEAVEHFEQALRLKTDYAEAQHNLGSALVGLGRVDEAMERWEEALRLDPNFAEAHNNLGAALVQRGKIEEAIAHYRLALQINPDYAKAHYNLGDALERTGRLPEAIAHFEQALRLKPDFVEAQARLRAIQ